jgi:hypothetical protein
MTTKLQLFDHIQLYAELQALNRFNSSGFCKTPLKGAANIFEGYLSEFKDI